MRKIFITIFFCWPIFCDAQDEWGYAVAPLIIATEEGHLIEILFISTVKKLSTLECKSDNEAAIDSGQDDIFSKCICNWLLNRIGETDSNVLSLVDRDRMYGDVELYSNPPTELQAKVQRPIQTAPTVFLSKQSALKKRQAFIELARTNKSFIVEID